MDETQRKKLEELNSDHHKRMSTMHCGLPQGYVDGQASQSLRSRSLLVHAMVGCRNATQALASEPRLELLEIGAGSAGDREYLMEQLGCFYSGVEVVERVAIAARERGVLHMAFEEAPAEWSGRFHFIYSRHVMEHTVNLELTLATLRRVLAPNGIIAAVTPAEPDNEPAHVTQQTLEEWCAHYRRHGLRPVYAMIETTVCKEAHIVCVHEALAARVFGAG